MEMREAAERVLFGSSLEEKLAPGPRVAGDAAPGTAIAVPAGPVRPAGLAISERGVRGRFPGLNRLDDDRERGRLMHFLANHELLAAELMALVLLRFPDAPEEYRRGVYEAMREEQVHTRLYLRRMRECGIEFGELPLNDYFWRLISEVRSPLEFVTRLNLTFEQANLDFSRHYAGKFHEVGDHATAAVLEKIYRDEIGHVGHGVKWFRRWKQGDRSDWKAFCDLQSFPLSPVRAKGQAPFNAEGRRLAGLDEDFIRHLECFEQSRGRTPVVAWFNPDAESHVAAAARGRRHVPNARVAAMEQDLEIAALAWCRRDDVLLLRRPPALGHLARLREAGLELPEIVPLESLDELRRRKLGGLAPWAWSPDAEALFAGIEVADNSVFPNRGALPPGCFSKELGLRLEAALGLEPGGRLFGDAAAAAAAAEVEALLARGEVVVKGVHSCAGRARRIIDARDTRWRGWLDRALGEHGAVVVEPRLSVVADFSALYELDGAGEGRLVGMSVMENDRAGRYRGTRVGRKWGNLLDPGVSAQLFAGEDVMDWYGTRVPAALVGLLPGYRGPLGVDAMVHRRDDGGLALRVVVEVNVRMTMGRVALEIDRRLGGRGGRLRVQRAGEPVAGLPLTEPGAAREFQLVWEGNPA